MNLFQLKNWFVISKIQNISFKKLCHNEADRIGKDKVYKVTLIN